MNIQELESTLTDIFQQAVNMNLLPDNQPTTCRQFIQNPQQMVAKKMVCSSDRIEKRLQEKRLQELTDSQEFKALQNRIQALKAMKGWPDYLECTEILFSKSGIRIDVNRSYIAQQEAAKDIRTHYRA